MDKKFTKVKEIGAGVHNLEDVMMSVETMSRVMGGPECETMMHETMEAQNSLSPFKQ